MPFISIADTEESDGGRDNDGAPYEMNKPEQMELMAPNAERVVVHFKVVSNKLRKRMFQRAMHDFQGAKLRTLDAIGKLHNTVDLVKFAIIHSLKFFCIEYLNYF